jgi:hypothetical protein
MSRLTDKGREPQQPAVAAAPQAKTAQAAQQQMEAASPALPPLPAVDWGRIGGEAPVLLPFDYAGPDAPLPPADAVVITWTTAEWSAFDHVFCNSGQPRSQKETAWQSDWKQYSKGAPPPPSSGTDYHLWGYYRMVQINGADGQPLKVLLFKAQTHLAYSPYLAGLEAMTQAILADTGCRYLYSIGTAGGVGEADLLGNTVVTNGGHLYMTNSNNAGSPLNNQTFFCQEWFPSFGLMEALQQQLLYPLSNVATWPQYEALFAQLQQKLGSENPPVPLNGITLNDLVNRPLDPANLHQATVANCQGKPLLTTDFYYIAQPGDAEKYCILEMDDAVLGAIAGQQGVAYAFVRNVSDPVVPSVTQEGQPIADAVRNEWSSLIYDTFGFYTSYNGALAAWATLAAMPSAL